MFIFSAFENTWGCLTSYGFGLRGHRLLDSISARDCTEIVRRASVIFVPAFQDSFPPPVVHIRRPHISEALVIPPLIVKLDELCHRYTQLLDFLTVRFALGIPAQAVLARLHEILQPLVVDGRMNPLATAQLCHRNLRTHTFEQDADLLFVRKSSAAGLFGAADQSARRIPRTRCCAR